MKNILLSLFLLFSISLYGDEGMWPPNMLPKKEIQKNYGVEINDVWVDHVQKSCLRMSTGGSASFVSKNGLVMTNHHVGSKAIYNLSSDSVDLLQNGFYAKGIEGELKCPNLYVDQLVSIRDVTSEINQPFQAGMTAAEREKARREVSAHLAKKAQEETGLYPQVVMLYQGARYHLYLYKRYTDVRLVMAPEKSIAFFGGDEENFEYPRHCLDVCFFRVYENNRPLATKDYFKWSKEGPKPEEPLFVLGHPGGTDRKLTSAHLAFFRDETYPFVIQTIKEKIEVLYNFQQESDENKRIAAQDLFSLRNSLKSFKAKYAGLMTTPIIKNKEKFEVTLFAEVDEQPWLDLRQALNQSKEYYQAYLLLEGLGSRYSKLYSVAKNLVRVSQERSLPNEKRLKEYTDSMLPALELALFSNEPTYMSLERVMLVDGLTRVQRLLGDKHPAVKAMLQGKSVQQAVSFLLGETELSNVSVRLKLYNNPELVKKSLDPMIVFAKKVDQYARAFREKYENELESVEKESYSKIMEAIFARHGESLYPDATFTLRLSVGTMTGYREYGSTIKPTTTLGGAFEKAEANKEDVDYELPKSWRDATSRLDKSVPFNFISTNDLIGGNSGSPVINKDAEIVGLVFDGNAQAFLWNFEFDQTQGRAISVHSQAIKEALTKIYDAESLSNELFSP